jgi:hypothetical protein
LLKITLRHRKYITITDCLLDENTLDEYLNTNNLNN